MKYDYIEPNPSRTYKDINIAFTKHPISKDVSVKSNDAAIKQALRNLVLLNINEKPFHPEIGGDIYNMLFENTDEPGTEEIIRYKIAAMIERYEPRIELSGINVNMLRDDNAVAITIYYTIINTLEPSSIEVFLSAIR